MSAIFVLKKNRKKNHKFFVYVKGRYFGMCDPTDMTVGMYCETSVGFLKGTVS